MAKLLHTDLLSSAPDGLQHLYKHPDIGHLGRCLSTLGGCDHSLCIAGQVLLVSICPKCKVAVSVNKSL